uniref:Morc S5 domain-containing protein n=1 Tax=Aegilops tauschii subsp. strangulata TaxID=200361 RepID=A0A453FQQ9_AEGTS
ANFIKPTHDKQDFEKSQLYQKLIIRLKDMTTEYWDLHSHLIGYQKKPRASVSPTPPGMLTASDTIAEPSERNAVGAGLSVAPWRGGTRDHPASAIPIAFAPPHLSVPAGTSGHAPCSMPAAQMVPATDSAETRKRRNEDDVQMDPCKRQAIQSLEVDNQICQRMTERDLNEFEHLKFENQQLHEECLELEVAEKELLLKGATVKAPNSAGGGAIQEFTERVHFRHSCEDAYAVDVTGLGFLPQNEDEESQTLQRKLNLNLQWLAT